VSEDVDKYPLVNGPSSLKDRGIASAELRSSLVLIQSKPLNPDAIDTYAEGALSDLIDLSASVTERYKEVDRSVNESGRELEDKAFEYFDLGNLGEVLNYIVSKDAEIKLIGKIIDSAQVTGQIIVPPDDIDPPSGNGNGEFKKKSVISRTKTLLFILSNDFDVALEDPEQFSIKTGVLSDNMMRGLSYFLINVPKLDRTVLCCDEEGNVTYVFNNKALEDHGIKPDDLATLTKSAINDLLTSDPNLGRRVVYSSRFVSGMINLMTSLESDKDTADLSGFYLYPKAPEGVLSATGLAKSLGISELSVLSEISNMGDLLGEVQSYRIFSNLRPGYTFEQQEIIRDRLKAKGVLSEQAPEEVLSVSGLAEKLGVSPQTIAESIKRLGSIIGETEVYKFTSRRTTGYSQEQQELIRQELESSGKLVQQATEDILSAVDVSKNLGIQHAAVMKAIAELGESLGNKKKYKFGSAITRGFSIEQQELIRQHVQQGRSAREHSLDGISSAYGLAQKYGLYFETVLNAIDRIKPSLGEVKTYRFGPRFTEGYSQEQQDAIERELTRNGNFAEPANDGVLSKKIFSNQIGVSDLTIANAVIALGDKLGEVKTYKFGNTPAAGYTQEQQEMIREFLNK